MIRLIYCLTGSRLNLFGQLFSGKLLSVLLASCLFKQTHYLISIYYSIKMMY